MVDHEIDQWSAGTAERQQLAAHRSGSVNLKPFFEAKSTHPPAILRGADRCGVVDIL